ncbi:MAG: chromate transporter [Alphaproteobacteria bacterium]|nr:chromate transporter [Alphaproteobacteria bacterium]
MDEDTLWALLRVFVPISLVSFGGLLTTIAEIQHQTIVVHGWITDREFVDIFAIARTAPGPGTLMVTLVGWHVAGWMGALVASLAFYVPTSILVGGGAIVWRRYRNTAWREKIERGLSPIATGLIFAGVYAVLNAIGGTVAAFATAGLSAAILLWRPLNPFLLLCGGAAVYLAVFLFN